MESKNKRYPDAFACNNEIPKIYKCEKCDFETNLKVSLTHHININHKNQKNFKKFRYVMRQCVYCEFQTYSSLLLLKHNKCRTGNSIRTEYETHNIINWLECGQCSYKSQNKPGYLSNHIMYQHSPISPMHQCEKCSFKTKIKPNLKQHIKSKHTKLKRELLECRNCSYETTWKSNLSRHVALKHPDSAIAEWHHCHICEFKTKLKQALKKHIAMTHNIVWYPCDKCEFKFKTKYTLKRHVSCMHTNSAWYRCDKCKYKTKQKSHLRQHAIKFHTDQTLSGIVVTDVSIKASGKPT